MPFKGPQVGSASHPPVGTIIDDGSLELVEVLGVGGYGVVYRAEETCTPAPKSYAVKCLVHSHLQPRQRQIHIREIALHQIASAHPNVITLHRVVETFHYTYIIMDYAPDSDMFTQILHHCRYLGDNHLIKHVFMQLLDAVEYCHSLGIYHRDLKPENILCFDRGLRIAITDFGLATTDKISEEFRTGSVYHMSPECQGGEFAPTGTYSPMFNDVWSLGIILLNLATGRNPWKSASISDPTFQAYLRDPIGFLPTVLPISYELNALLVRTLEIDWRDRITLAELRESLEDITNFYSEGVIFEGSMARCPWEAGMEIQTCSSSSSMANAKPKTAKPQQQPASHRGELKSYWSEDSESDIVFATNSMTPESSYGVPWDEYSSGTTWAFEGSDAACDEHDETNFFTVLRSTTDDSLLSPVTSPGPSMPSTPNSIDVNFVERIERPRKPLTIDTNFTGAHYYAGNPSMGTYVTDSSAMQTAVEYDPYSASLFITSPISPFKAALPSNLDHSIITEDKEMHSPSTLWEGPSIESLSMSNDLSRYDSYRTSMMSEDITEIPRSSAPSPELLPSWPQISIPSPPSSPEISMSPSPTKKLVESRAKSSGSGISIFGHFTFFGTKSSSPKPPSPPPPSASTMPATISTSANGERHFAPPFIVPFDLTPRSASDSRAPASNTRPRKITSPSSSWMLKMGLFSEHHSYPFRQKTTPSAARTSKLRNQRRAAYSRSPRHWFLPGKLFASNHQ